MARKEPAEEHENLERWLVSYADFMTLLFATFVVLYALVQSDISSFRGIEDALKKAFTQNIFDNNPSILSGQSSILEGYADNSSPLMLEYMSQKYEQTSYDEIKNEINKLKKEGLEAHIDDRGLVIKLDNHAIQFDPATAKLVPESYPILDDVAKIIKSKFSIHYIQVEGHSDSDNISTTRFPSNWELSSARASSVVRYLIKHHDFNPKIFSVVGLADTVPLVENNSAINKAKNRRVEIVVLRNKNKNLSQKDMQKILEEAKLYRAKKENERKELHDTYRSTIGHDKELLKNVIDVSKQYKEENKRINALEDENYIQDSTIPSFMEH